jgi:hypothetical protein
MISCETFRSRFVPATGDAEVLGHLRHCDACLDHAAQIDPDVMFRALGGAELVPPGGVEAFVGDVMRQVRVRDAEKHTLAPVRAMSWPRRLAVAATLTAGFSTGTFFYARRPLPVTAPVPSIAKAAHAELATKPVVETYDSANATIVEVPAAEADDVKIVMIFDENLPADL